MVVKHKPFSVCLCAEKSQMNQTHTEFALERRSDVLLHITITQESFPVAYSINLGSNPQPVYSNNLIPPPLFNIGKTRVSVVTIKQRRWCLCNNARLSHCPSECLLVCVSCPGFWKGQSFFPFPPRAGLHRKAGWLAGGTGKETASIKQQMEDSMCLHCRNTHNTQTRFPAQILC